ncbi:MAG: hypothetical protein ABIR00_02140 [Nitrosospira sp.]
MKPRNAFLLENKKLVVLMRRFASSVPAPLYRIPVAPESNCITRAYDDALPSVCPRIENFLQRPSTTSLREIPTKYRSTIYYLLRDWLNKDIPQATTG